MTRLALGCLALLACSGKDTTSQGPAYTPAAAQELAVLAPSCELGAGTGTVREIRTCKGNHATAIISLDAKHHFVKLEIQVNSWTTKLAKDRLDRALGPVLTRPVLAKIGEGLGQPVSEGTLDGVGFRTTRSADEFAHYELTLTW